MVIMCNKHEQIACSVLQSLTGTITGVCILNVVLGVCFIGTISVLQSLGHPQATGWVSALGASVIFGSTGLPFKTDSLESVSVDPILFALFSSLGIFLVSLPLALVLIQRTGEFFFEPWSLLGSVDILATTLLAFHTVQKVGYAKGPAIWATTGIVFSFLLGAVAFHETITGMVAAVVSIPCLVAGMLLILSCQATADKEVISVITTTEYTHVPTIDGEETAKVGVDKVHIELTVTGLSTCSENCEENDEPNNTQANNDNQSNSNNILLGLCLGILTGLVDGSLMAPFKLSHATNGIETYHYLASFGFSSLTTTPILFVLYNVFLWFRGRPISKDQIKLAAIPGTLNGILWGLANVMSVTATFHLSMRIAFPLTQTCVLWATGWGMLYFQEIEKTQETLGKLGSGFGFFMLGTVLLAESSSSDN